MTNRDQTHKAIFDEVACNRGRSRLFWWLVQNHDEIVKKAAGNRMRWQPLCVLFAEHGLTDINGRPPTPRTARETWFQARRLVAAAKARMHKQEDVPGLPGQVLPSRISPDWRPVVVPPPPVRPPPPPHSLVPVVASGADKSAANNDGIVMSPEAQAVLDEALAMLKRETRKQFPFG